MALVGEPVHCTIEVANAGPGLPRDTRVEGSVRGAGSALDYVVDSPTYRFGGDSFACEPMPPNEFECDLGTVPVGGTATIEVAVTPLVGGRMTNGAYVTTESTDTDAQDNEDDADVDVFRLVDLDISPQDGLNRLRVGANSKVIVAVLSTPEFDARTIDPLSVCFGDAEAPAERSCNEVHGKGHYEDVDRDGDVDLVLHFRIDETGIDLGDTRACAIGTTVDGVGVYGCDAVDTH